MTRKWAIIYCYNSLEIKLVLFVLSLYIKLPIVSEFKQLIVIVRGMGYIHTRRKGYTAALFEERSRSE